MRRQPRRDRVLLICRPGAPTRQLNIPGAWPLFLAAIVVCSVALSVCVGRTVRALYDGQVPRRPAHLLARDHYHAARNPAQRFAWQAPGGPTLPQLRLFDLNAKRGLTITPFDREGQLYARADQALRAFLRCRRTGLTTSMNPRLIALLTRISQHYGGVQLDIISAHRAVDGVVTSESSQHGKGNAADIRIEGVSVEALAQTAHELGAGGVGLYFKHRFVHVDVRDKPYSWREDQLASESEPSPL